MAWISGQKLQSGKYTIEKELGVGGFGITYRARDNNGQKVVIKTLNDAVQRRADFTKFQQDFLNEAIRLAKCNHPHIVKIYEVIQEGNLSCIVMEYIDWEDLATLVEKRCTLSESESLGYIQQIGEALTVVHNNGLLHRDIKPHNIMIRSNKPEAVLIDFGIAREFTQNLTQTHTQMLADGFAPIEQYDKRAKRGAYTDVYALAATLYCLVTGEVPTIAPMRVIGTELEQPKRINPCISDRVEQAILKGMEIKADERPQSIQEYLKLLGISDTEENYTKGKNPILGFEDNIIRKFNSYVDYNSKNSGLLIHHKDLVFLDYHITISDTYAFSFGVNGFVVFPIPPNYEIARSVKLLSRKEVLNRCLVAYQLFKNWEFGVLGWNGEHFARLVTTSEAISYQVKHSPVGWLNHYGYHPEAKHKMDEAWKRTKF